MSSSLASSVASGIPASDVLYDKIIDVDLIYSERNEQIDGYYITKDGKAVSGDLDTNSATQSQLWYVGGANAKYQGATQIGSTKDNGTSYGYSDTMTIKEKYVSYTLYRFKDYTHKEYAANGAVTVVVAKGKVYRYDFAIDSDKNNFNRGHRPDGELLQAGDKLYVNDHGTYKKFHVDFLANVPKKDANASTSHVSYSAEVYKAVPITRVVKDVVSIKCPEGGMKPSIAFSTNLIPGQHCYKLQLKITNLELTMDVRKIKNVRIKAGYRTQGFTEVFTCPVFSSYIESPNPDGVTVFECLCVGRTTSFTENRPYTFAYLGGKTTIFGLIKAVADGMNLTAESKLLDPYLEFNKDGTPVIDSETGKQKVNPGYNGLEISVPKMDTYAENGTAVLEWLRKVIQQRIASAEGAPLNNQDGYKYSQPYVMVQVNNGTLFVYMLNRRNSDTSQQSTTVVSLDQVKGATFNGVALTVKALWNPRLNPGDVFQMKPNIINGANLPNTLDVSAYGNEKQYDSQGNLIGNQYLYRCVTMSIAFSTNGSENEMSILALPIKYIDEVKDFGTTTIQSMREFALSVSQNYDTTGSGHIEIGNGDTGETTETTEAKKEKVVTTNVNKMFDQDILKLFGTTRSYQIQAGDNLSTLASSWFNSENSPEGPSICAFDIYPTTGLVQKSILWPIIAVLTYRYWKDAGQKSGNLNAYENMEHLSEPDLIRIGNYLVIPTIENIDQLKQCKDIFKYAADAYESTHPNYQRYVREWRRLYKYLAGETK